MTTPTSSSSITVDDTISGTVTHAAVCVCMNAQDFCQHLFSQSVSLSVCMCPHVCEGQFMEQRDEVSGPARVRGGGAASGAATAAQASSSHITGAIFRFDCPSQVSTFCSHFPVVFQNQDQRKISPSHPVTTPLTMFIVFLSVHVCFCSSRTNPNCHIVFCSHPVVQRSVCVVQTIAAACCDNFTSVKLVIFLLLDFMEIYSDN